ncbi:MAG TPA: leucyl aminopeptidase [Flavobacteriales bacterium]|jgi:leucyl aminopeptidase|nr:leucyl aminopeptidase [Flavobacteriales bacterium]HQW31780.1 leucyl aminopeptidase [Flavobacteriales bacterium]HQY02319.1 leucyl aminopeptidase [Flavobacteriales bacterium]HQY79504.1 leucyl aminopeptidase [Flavobacteriales bacterium]HRA16394.1 leucyl aminopeptidase [Flavobacteriales bacterium]
MLQITKTNRTAGAKDMLVILADPAQLRSIDLERNDRQYLLEQLKDDALVATCDISGRLVMVHQVRQGPPSKQLEKARQAGNAMALKLIAAKREEAQAVSLQDDADLTLALVEGATLGSYAFNRHKTGEQPRTLKKLSLIASVVKPAALQEMLDVCEATLNARDLVNEPASHLSAVQLGEAAQKLAKSCGFTAKVMNKKQIEAEKMGGLLAVNQGSIDPPVFIVMEWKPKNAVNKKPVLLVGKGVVYDTGGLSLKPTPNSMDSMKCDMGGSAAVIGAISIAAKQKLPLHVVALVPSTDNRPGGKAFAPGDVLKMHSGLTVENLNSDAEGRLILADALSYGERYDAEVVFTLATLTGAAMRAIGTQGTVTMGTASEKQFAMLHAAADTTFERVAQMPFWEEYDEELKSDVADLKNIGGAMAGQITAGKFLARFTTKPLIHLDIAGPAFLDKRDHYRTKGGTGVGVRLVYEFLKRRAAAK